jgi:hypothetical protein
VRKGEDDRPRKGLRTAWPRPTERPSCRRALNSAEDGPGRPSAGGSDPEGLQRGHGGSADPRARHPRRGPATLSRSRTGWPTADTNPRRPAVMDRRGQRSIRLRDEGRGANSDLRVPSSKRTPGQEVESGRTRARCLKAERCQRRSSGRQASRCWPREQPADCHLAVTERRSRR